MLKSHHMHLNDIRAAAARIAPFIKPTPLEKSLAISELLGVETSVKYELFQRTGSFKPRGAFNKMLQMTDEEKRRGVVAVSGGNHAQATAFAATRLGIESIVLMPETTPVASIEATRSYGAETVLLSTIAACFAEAERYVANGKVFVHPFDDPEVIAGQSTVGLEIFDAMPDVTDVIVSIGGGGLAAGVAVALKALKDDVRIWGVETEGADAMSHAIAAGHPVELPAITSIAKTLGAPYVTDLTLELVKENLESVTVVSDHEAVESLIFIADHLKVVTEPSASCTLAAAKRLRENFDDSTRLLLIFCGGNVTIDDICGYRRRFIGE